MKIERGHPYWRMWTKIKPMQFALLYVHAKKRRTWLAYGVWKSYKTRKLDTCMTSQMG